MRLAAKARLYADVRIGRYLNQFIITRDDKVENIINTETYGVGIRVIADGTWGFAATDTVTKDGLARAADRAVAIAKANAKVQKEPLQLAPTPSLGEVSWKTPIEKNPFEVPLAEKTQMLLEVSASAMKAGASFVNSLLFQVNEQKYFASTDGCVRGPGHPPDLADVQRDRGRQGQWEVQVAGKPGRADGHGLPVPWTDARRRRSRA